VPFSIRSLRGITKVRTPSGTDHVVSTASTRPGWSRTSDSAATAPEAVAIVGFALNFAAYAGEMLRTGIAAVPAGQREAALAIGFTPFEAFWRVVFPQALRHILPVYRGEVIGLLKATSIVGYIAVVDLTKVSDLIRARTYEAFFPLIATAVIYFFFARLIARALARAEYALTPIVRRKKGVRA